ncbi:hypothetical protein ACFO4N_11615 [Camelliibacillus cellulosilyticus]|uniref:Uncharacterized protein n=1 Tax=Camelliibacillus cellulosilyticus TaxID=2174486 RepID=A0ABV9GMG4_9BACL
MLDISGYQGEALKLYTFKEQDHREDAAWIQMQCRRFGIKIEAYFLEPEVLTKPKTINEADIIHDSATISEHDIMSFLHLILDENSFIKKHFHPKIKQHLANWTDQCRFCPDLEEVFGRFLDLEMEILRVINILPLYRNQAIMNTHQSVQNASINAQGWMDFYDVWFKNAAE